MSKGIITQMGMIVKEKHGNDASPLAIWCICFANMMLLIHSQWCNVCHKMWRSHASLGEAVIIGRCTTSFAKSKHRWKKHCSRSAFFWWGMVDSDHRSRWQQIYSLPPLAAREIPHIVGHGAWPFGAGDRSRTNNLLITNQLLCHWATPANCSFANCIRFRNGNIISQEFAFVKPFLKKYLYLFFACVLFLYNYNVARLSFSLSVLYYW